jgi:hypothetical protein
MGTYLPPFPYPPDRKGQNEQVEQERARQDRVHPPEKINPVHQRPHISAYMKGAMGAIQAVMRRAASVTRTLIEVRANVIPVDAKVGGNLPLRVVLIERRENAR